MLGLPNWILLPSVNKSRAILLCYWCKLETNFSPFITPVNLPARKLVTLAGVLIAWISLTTLFTVDLLNELERLSWCFLATYNGILRGPCFRRSHLYRRRAFRIKFYLPLTLQDVLYFFFFFQPHTFAYSIFRPIVQAVTS